MDQLVESGEKNCDGGIISINSQKAASSSNEIKVQSGNIKRPFLSYTTSITTIKKTEIMSGPADKISKFQDIDDIIEEELRIQKNRIQQKFSQQQEIPVISYPELMAKLSQQEGIPLISGIQLPTAYSNQQTIPLVNYYPVAKPKPKRQRKKAIPLTKVLPLSIMPKDTESSIPFESFIIMPGNPPVQQQSFDNVPIVVPQKEIVATKSCPDPVPYPENSSNHIFSSSELTLNPVQQNITPSSVTPLISYPQQFPNLSQQNIILTSCPEATPNVSQQQCIFVSSIEPMRNTSEEMTALINFPKVTPNLSEQESNLISCTDSTLNLNEQEKIVIINCPEGTKNLSSCPEPTQDLFEKEINHLSCPESTQDLSEKETNHPSCPEPTQDLYEKEINHLSCPEPTGNPSKMEIDLISCAESALNLSDSEVAIIACSEPIRNISAQEATLSSCPEIKPNPPTNRPLPINLQSGMLNIIAPMKNGNFKLPMSYLAARQKLLKNKNLGWKTNVIALEIKKEDENRALKTEVDSESPNSPSSMDILHENEASAEAIEIKDEVKEEENYDVEGKHEKKCKKFIPKHVSKHISKFIPYNSLRVKKSQLPNNKEIIENSGKEKRLPYLIKPLPEPDFEIPVGDDSHEGQLVKQLATRKFSSRLLVKEHLKALVDLNKLVHVCVLCGHKTFTLQALIGHFIDHHLYKKDKVFPCNMCNEIFTANADLKVHKIETHLENNYCDLCGLLFVNHQRLESHLARHPILTCDICEEEFKDIFSIRRHKEIRHYSKMKLKTPQQSDEKISCSLCDIPMESEKHLELHNRIKHKELKEETL